MSTDVVPFERQMVLAEAFAKSKLFGCENKEQALSLMALCEAQGLHPANAVQEYHIINGRPSLKADAMLTRFQRSGGRVKFLQYTDECVEAEFDHPQGGSLTVKWDMQRAKRAELGGKGMWLKYPRQMLRSRVISEGVRALFPGVLGGLYSPEEVQDFEQPRGVVVSPRPEEPVPLPRAETEVQDFLRWAENRLDTAIVERWDVIQHEHALMTRVKDELKRRYPDAAKYIAEVIATAQQARKAARKAQEQVTDAEIVQ